MTHTPKSIDGINSFRRRALAVTVAGGILFSALFLANPLTAQMQGRNSGRQVQVPNPFPFPEPSTSRTPRRTEKQKEALLKYNFKNMQKHADKLAELAQALQKKINQSNEDVLSLEVVRQAEEIEKLAKKIKNEAKGY